MLNAYPKTRERSHANACFGETFNRNQFGGFFVASIVTAAPEVREKPWRRLIEGEKKEGGTPLPSAGNAAAGVSGGCLPG